MFGIVLSAREGDQDQYSYGGWKEPTTMTTPPSSSFTVATTMTDYYGKFEGGEGGKSKEKAE